MSKLRLSSAPLITWKGRGVEGVGHVSGRRRHRAWCFNCPRIFNIHRTQPVNTHAAPHAVQIQCCSASTETMRTIRDGELRRPPRLSHSSWLSLKDWLRVSRSSGECYAGKRTTSVRFPASAPLSLQTLWFVDTVLWLFVHRSEWENKKSLIAAHLYTEVILVVTV